MQHSKWTSSAALLLAALALAGCDSRHEEAQREALGASGALAAGSTFSAQVHIKRALDLRDDVPDYWRLWGRIALKQGNGPDAYQAFRNAVALDPQDIDSMRFICNLGGQMLDPGVEKYADRLLVTNPNDPSALMAKGRMALERRDRVRAMKYAQMILNQIPDDTGGLLLQARSYTMARQDAQAATILEGLLNRHSKEPWLLEDLKRIYSDKGDLAKFEYMFELQAQAAPTDWHRQISFAEILYARGEMARAYSLIKAQMQVHPKDPILAGAILKLMQLDGATAMPANAIQADASSVSLVMRAVYASYANSLNMPDITLSLLKLDDPQLHTSSDATAALAEALAMKGRRDEAQQLVEDFVADNPSPSRVLLVKSRLLYGQKRYELALADARILVASDPGNVEAQLLLADIFWAKGEKNMAITALRDALNENKSSVLIAKSLVHLLDATGQTAAAQTVIDDIAQANALDRRIQALRSAYCERPGAAKCRTLIFKKKIEEEQAKKAGQAS